MTRGEGCGALRLPFSDMDSFTSTSTTTFRSHKIMSKAAKLTLLGTSMGALGIIAFVHYAQKTEKAVCDPYSL